MDLPDLPTNLTWAAPLRVVAMVIAAVVLPILRMHIHYTWGGPVVLWPEATIGLGVVIWLGTPKRFRLRPRDKPALVLVAAGLVFLLVAMVTDRFFGTELGSYPDPTQRPNLEATDT